MAGTDEHPEDDGPTVGGGAPGEERRASPELLAKLVHGAPVVMISGDQSACVEAAALCPGVVTAVVKQAKGRNAAECLPPAVTAELIEQCAAKGVDHLLGERPPQPFRLEAPVTVTLEFVKSEMADAAALMPGARRGVGKQVEYVAADMPEAYRAFRSLVSIA